MTDYPKKWVYRFYVNEDGGTSCYYHAKEDTRFVETLSDGVRVTMIDGSQYNYNNRYLIYWRLCNETQYPEIPYTGRIGAY